MHGTVLQAASALAFFWLDVATVYALGLALIAAVYIGFAVAVADGRGKVIAVEVGAGVLIAAALIAVTMVADVTVGW